MFSSNKRCVRSTATAATIALLCGCVAVPKVEYRKITGPDQITGEEFDSIALQKSIIVLDAKKDAKGEPVIPLELSANSIPAEYGDFKIALYHRDRLGVKTNLVISKIENTDLAKEVGLEVVDNRVELIGKVGGIITSLAKVMAFSGSVPVTFPLRIDPLIQMQNAGIGKEPGRFTTAEGVIVEVGPLATDARPIEALPVGEAVSSFFYSACRTAMVKVPTGKGDLKQSFKISDPRFFQSIGLPKKGKITLHSQCGASASSEKDPTKSQAEVIAAFVTQAIAIKDAIDATKKEED